MLMLPSILIGIWNTLFPFGCLVVWVSLFKKKRLDGRENGIGVLAGLGFGLVSVAVLYSIQHASNAEMGILYEMLITLTCSPAMLFSSFAGSDDPVFRFTFVILEILIGALVGSASYWWWRNGYRQRLFATGFFILTHLGPHIYIMVSSAN